MSPRMRSFPGLLGESPEPVFLSQHLLDEEPKEIQNDEKQIKCPQAAGRKLKAEAHYVKACFTTVKP